MGYLENEDRPKTKDPLKTKTPSKRKLKHHVTEQKETRHVKNTPATRTHDTATGSSFFLCVGSGTRVKFPKDHAVTEFRLFYTSVKVIERKKVLPVAESCVRVTRVYLSSGFQRKQRPSKTKVVGVKNKSLRNPKSVSFRVEIICT